MNFYSEAVFLAVILAANLLLFGAILTGGLALAFKLTENISPLLRYAVSVIVFLSAILLPVAVALKTPSKIETNLGSAEKANRVKGVEISVTRAASSVLRNIDLNQSVGSEDLSGDYLDQIIQTAAASPLGAVFPGLWIAGIIFFLFRESVGFRHLSRARKLWIFATDAEKERLLCPKNVTLYFDENQSPGTIGLLRPAIVLPKRFLGELPLDAQRFIVRHELAHAQRRDPLIGFLIRTVRALFWVSPALWLLERVIDSEREAAADRAAIASLSGEANAETAALNYAEALLTTAKKFNSFVSQNGKPQTVGIGSASELEIRIRRLLLLSSRITRPQIVSVSAAFALTLAVVSIVPSATFSDGLINRQRKITIADNTESRFAGDISEQPNAVSRIADRIESKKTDRLVSNSKAGANEKSSPVGAAKMTQVPTAFIKARNDVEDFNGGETIDEAVSLERLAREDMKAAESLGNQPARKTGLPEADSSLKKLYADLKSDNEFIRQKAASRLDYLARPRESDYPDKPATNDYGTGTPTERRQSAPTYSPASSGKQ